MLPINRCRYIATVTSACRYIGVPLQWCCRYHVAALGVFVIVVKFHVHMSFVYDLVFIRRSFAMLDILRFFVVVYW